MKMPPRKLGNGKREMTKDDQDQSYKEKRNKNNDAVKRSRQKTKVQAKETMDKVSRLKQVRSFIFRWRVSIHNLFTKTMSSSLQYYNTLFYLYIYDIL